MTEPRIGDKVRFTPAAYAGTTGTAKGLGRTDLPVEVTGRIIFVNRRHRWYQMEYIVNGVTLREGVRF